MIKDNKTWVGGMPGGRDAGWVGSLVGEGSGGAPAGTGLLGGAQVGHFAQGEGSSD